MPRRDYKRLGGARKSPGRLCGKFWHFAEKCGKFAEKSGFLTPKGEWPYTKENAKWNFEKSYSILHKVHENCAVGKLG